jgi:transcriptional regulator GlxA family with amidase domain
MKTRRIGIIGYDGLQALDVAGPADVFATANSRLERKTAPYEIVLLGLHEGPIATESGLSLYTDTTLSRHGLLDTIIIPGGRALREKPKVRAAVAG